MIDEPRIIKTEEQLTAALRLTIPRADMRAVMGPALKELRDTIKAQDVQPTGPWLNYHLRRAPDIFDFEIAIPVNKAVTQTGRVSPSSLPAATVARTIYQGPYENLAGAWAELESWIKAHAHKPDISFWECYLSGPDASPDPNGYRTELTWALLGSR